MVIRNILKISSQVAGANSFLMMKVSLYQQGSNYAINIGRQITNKQSLRFEKK